MITDNTSWNQSVTAVVIENGKVLLARHTYGRGKGKLIVPGGYIEKNESPQAAVEREYMEETGIKIKPERVIAIRFNAKDWYIAFSAKYISGTAHTDNDENSEVIWMPVDEALKHNDVPALTKSLIKCALTGRGLEQLEYEGFNPPFSFYGIK